MLHKNWFKLVVTLLVVATAFAGFNVSAPALAQSKVRG